MAAGTLLRMAKVMPESLWVLTPARLNLSAASSMMAFRNSFGAAGNLAAKGKIPYAILTLMDVLRSHPGQVSNFEMPCLLRHSLFNTCFC